MADLSLVQDDCLEESDEGVYEQGDGPSGGDVGDDGLTPLLRIKKYSDSEKYYDRQMVPRILLELFKLASPDSLTVDLPHIMGILAKLVEGDEILVITDVLQQVPNLASTAMECSQRVPALGNIVSEHLLPLVVRNLGTSENQVRKTAHATIFALMEQGLVSKAQAEIQVCPTVLALSRKECLMYYHTDAVTLMSKMVPLLGRDVTERVFLERFGELCMNKMFYVRKVCASHFGDFCAVVGKASYDNVLLPTYIKLCSDEIWGVRKACADVAMTVSCACPPATRKTVLAPVFAKLLRDDNRWVRISAFQTLGPFISTFADPTITTLAYNNLGELVLNSIDGSEYKINSSIPSSVYHEDKHMYCLSVSIDDLKEVIDMVDYYDEDKSKQNPESTPAIEQDEDEMYNNLSEEKQTELSAYALSLCAFDEDALLSGIDQEGTSSPEDEKKEENIEAVSAVEDKMVENQLKEDNRGETNNSDKLDINNVSTITNQLMNIYLSNNDSSEGKDEDNLDSYNSYNYWYVPPDNMPLDPSIIDAGSSANTSNHETVANSNVEASESLNSNSTKIDQSISGDVLNQTYATTENVALNQTYAAVTSNVNSIAEKVELVELKEPDQHIVPQLLIDYFISMTDPEIAKNTDDNIAYHCAYSLPAVALTLGSQNWHLLKDTVEKLAADMQYKVRRTVASSLHELALILGPEMASSNLTPIFNGFLKDLDEVRIGVLNNLAQFLRLITPSKRLHFLPKLQFFLQNNHELNWRFRHELAEQLMLAVDLFPPNEASKHISYISQILLRDKVSAVRQIALHLVAELLRHISSESGLTARLLIVFAEKFAHSKKWKLRQTFVMLSEELLHCQIIAVEQFSSEVMPHLLDLSWDPVPNVRLAVASTIANYMISNEYFADPENQHYDGLQTVLRRLQTDKDRDVRFSAQSDRLAKVSH